jgi:hypothetical protein
MNPIAKMLIDMARFYAYDLAERQLEMYVEVLGQFDPEMVVAAGADYVKDIRNTKFPVPPHVIFKNYILDPKHIAVASVRRVRKAIREFGYYRPTEAREYIGEPGWSAVEAFGGWDNLCANLGGSINESHFMAQARDTIEIDVTLRRLGIDTTKQLPDGNIPIGQLITKLAEQKQLGGKVKNGN